MNQLASRMSVASSDTPSSKANGAGDLQLRDILAVLRRRIWLLLAVVAVIVLAGALIILSLPAKFTAATTLMIETREQRVVDIDSVVSGLSGDNATMDTQIRLLTSDELLRTVAVDLNLTEVEEFNRHLNAGGGIVDTVASWFGIESSWVDASAGGTPGETEDPEQVAAMQLNAVIDALRDRLTVRQLGLSTVIEVGVTSLDPRLATQIANSLANTYIRRQVEAKLDATQQANDWLQSRLAQLRVDVLEAERAVEDYRANTELVDRVSPELAQDLIHQLGIEAVDAEIELSNARTLLATIEDGVDEASFFDVLSTMEPAVAATVIAQWRFIMQTSPVGETPDASAALTRSQEFTEQFTTAMRAYLTNRVEVARQKLDFVNLRLAEMQTQAAQLDLEMVDLRALEREAEATRTVLELFLNRLRQTEQIDFERPDARIVSRATVPTEPSQPNRPLLFAVAILIGGIIGLGAVILLESLDRRIRSVRELEAVSQLKALATFPFVRKTNLEKIVQELRQNPITPWADAARSLVLNLMKEKREPGRAVTVLLTSSVPNEGKSTSAAMIASVAAMTGLRAVLIDTDVRKQTLTRSLAPGDDDLATGGGHVSGESPTENLIFVPTRPFANSSNTGVRPEVFDRVIRQMQTAADLIIIDSTPVLSVSDCKALMPFVDGVVFLVKANATRRDDVEQALRDLRLFDANLLGAVLTMDRARGNAYRYKYYYGAKAPAGA